MKLITANIFSFARKPNIIAFLFWVTTCVALITYSTAKQYILPNYFFFDENTISRFITSNARFEIGESYASTAAFFSLIGATKNSLLFTLISTLFIMSQYYYCLKKSKVRSFTLIEILLFVFLSFLSMTYMTMLSKELIVALVLAPFIFLARRGLIGIIIWCVIALVYATYYRTYWFIMIPMFLGLYWIIRSTKKPIYLIVSVPLALLALSIAFSAFLGLDLDNFRTTVNDYRIDSGDNNARTMILPWLAGGGPIVSWLNSSITWLTLMIPLPLFILLSPYYLLIATLITLLFYKSWRAFFNIQLEHKQSDLPACAALIISFTAIQSIFEPDYGSYVKHLAPLFPLFFYVIFKSQQPSKNKPLLKPKRSLKIAK